MVAGVFRGAREFVDAGRERRANGETPQGFSAVRSECASFSLRSLVRLLDLGSRRVFRSSSRVGNHQPRSSSCRPGDARAGQVVTNSSNEPDRHAPQTYTEAQPITMADHGGKSKKAETSKTAVAQRMPHVERKA